MSERKENTFSTESLQTAYSVECSLSRERREIVVRPVSPDNQGGPRARPQCRTSLHNTDELLTMHPD